MSAEKKSLIGVRVATDYRAVAHLVEGVIVLLCSSFIIVGHGIQSSLAIFTIYGIFETSRGLFLMWDIINDNRNNLNWYLALSFVNFILRHGSGTELYRILGLDGLYFRFSLFIELFLFIYEVIWFIYVCKFYWNIATTVQKVKEEDENSNILSRIFTDYRAIAHIVEGITVCFVVVSLTLYTYFFETPDTSYLIYSLYGIYVCSKGSLLLRGLIKENKQTIVLYTALEFSTIMIKLGAVAFVCQKLQPGDTFFFIYAILALLYFSYEWFLLCCVIKFAGILNCGGNYEKNENEISYEKLEAAPVAVHI